MQRILYLGNDIDSIRTRTDIIAQEIRFTDVSMAHDPTSVLENILRLNPDLIILDLNLTYRVTRNLFIAIRKTETLKEMPILVISRAEFMEDWLQGFYPITGPDDYIVFPFLADELIERIKHLLSHGSNITYHNRPV